MLNMFSNGGPMRELGIHEQYKLEQLVRRPLSSTVRTFVSYLPLVSTATAVTLLKGLDVSAYQVNVPWADLVAHGLGFAVIKGDQATATDNHMAQARTANVPLVGEYFWDDPTQTAQAQIDCFAADVREHNPDFIMLDVEQYWAYWQQFWDYLAGKITQAMIVRKSPTAISDHAWFVLSGLKKLFPNLTVGLYTGTWFVNTYAQPMISWMGSYPLWMA